MGVTFAECVHLSGGFRTGFPVQEKCFLEWGTLPTVSVLAPGLELRYSTTGVSSCHSDQASRKLTLGR